MEWEFEKGHRRININDRPFHSAPTQLKMLFSSLEPQQLYVFSLQQQTLKTEQNHYSSRTVHKSARLMSKSQPILYSRSLFLFNK
jgi:hypothetical protein